MASNDYRRSYWNFFSCPRLTFGPRSVVVLEQVIEQCQAERVLVVSDRQLKQAGVLEYVTAILDATPAKTHVFDEGEPEPSSDLVERAAAFARPRDPELVVAVGGGSNMDLAKACAAVLSHACPAVELFGVDKVPGPVLPLVCLPTTAGTGSEMSHAAVIKNSETGKKASILSHRIRPHAAIVDPHMTITCPKRVTAESGIDALTHALEAFMVRGFYAIDSGHGPPPYEGNHPMGDMYAERAIRLIGAHLRRVVEEPEDLAARSAMALAASLAGAAFASCGVCIVHGLEYPVGARYRASHGAGNGILLPSVLRYWLPERTKRLAQVAEWLGVENDGRLSEQEAAEAAVAAIEQLRADVGLPGSLSEVGAAEADLPSLAAEAAQLRRLTDLSPRDPTEEDLLSILKNAF